MNGWYVRQRNLRQKTIRAECPCCGWKGYDFAPLYVGAFWVPRDLCPQCSSCMRHRGMHMYLTRTESAIIKGAGRVLNLAPEPYIRNIIDKNPAFHYIGGDLALGKLYQAPGRSVQLDINHMPIPSGSMDFVFCFHLLEHLPDERPAIAEMFRVLKPGGIAYIMVPINLSQPDSINFGCAHPDYFGHYWFHARDFIEKLRAFDAQEVWPHDYLSKEEEYRYGVLDTEILYRCVKPAVIEEQVKA
jgi:SAM-dependent methyltransferase